MKSAVKLLVGTCVSLGVLIDSKSAKEIEKDIDAGTYDREIAEEIIQPSEEKIKELQAFFSVVKERQDKEQKALAEAKAAEEAAKAAAIASAPSAAATAGAPVTAASAAPSAPAKKEEPKKEIKKK